MAEFEKYIPKKVVKDISPASVDAGGNRQLLPGDLTDAFNVRYYKRLNGSSNIKGNTIMSFALPAGTNIMIGSFQYTKKNSIVNHYWNSNGDHRVIEWNFDTQAFTVLLFGPSLNYDKDHLIVQGNIIDDFHIYNDGLNRPRKFNIARAKTGAYHEPYAEWELSLCARPPLDPPTFVYVSDGSFPFNYISKSIYQFSYQFIYLDGEESTFSPLSKLAYNGEIYDPTILTNNAIDVTLTVPSELLPLIRTVNVAYRESNDGNYFIFKQIQFPASPTLIARFTGNDITIAVGTSKQVQLYDRIPARTDALGFIENRLFIVLNDLGFDIPNTFDLTVTLGAEAYVANQRYLKMGGAYNVGIILEDNFGQTTFVKARKGITVPYSWGGDSQILGATKNFINWTLSGFTTNKFSKYQVVLSKNNYQQVYGECKVIPYLYQSQMPSNMVEGDIASTYYIWRGRKWAKLETANIVSGGRVRSFRPDYKYVYFQYPQNFAFTPDNTYYIRVLSPGFATKIIPIVGIEEDFIIVDLQYFDPGPTATDGTVNLIDWSLFTEMMVEIFLPAEGQDQFFYETGKTYDIIDGVFQTASGKLYGDTYIIKSVRTKYKFQYTPMVLNSNTYVPPQQILSNNGPDTIAVESPTGIFSSSVLPIDTLTVETDRASRASGIGADTTQRNSLFKKSAVQVSLVFSLDYNRIASDYGRVHTFDDTERKLDQNTSVGFSDPFVLNTLIFGMNTFDPANKYDIPKQRTPVRMLQPAGDDGGDILLALHERNCSSLYIGQGLIRQGQDFILAKTDSVIGDDRSLAYGAGCINPESVREIYGEVYFWDAYQGAVQRYSKAGIFPISSYGMTYYFYTKGKQYEPYRNQIKVVTGHDAYNEEFLITFPAVPEAGILAETWCFSIVMKCWTTRYGFVPEFYSRLNNSLYSFLNGQMWIHETNALYNNFYGVQHESSWTFVVNVRLGKNKRLLNIHILGDICADMSSEQHVIEIDTPEGQQSFIPAYEFTKDEGKWVAAVLKDINTPDVPASQLALRSGDDMASSYFLVKVINNRTDEGNISQVNAIYKLEEFSI